MQVAPVIPVLVIKDIDTAQALAEALVSGGLPVLEVTLRTPQALEAIKLMSEVSGAIVGVGTALDGSDLQQAQNHGAQFAVSPGYTNALGQTAKELQLPLLPGTATPSDIMRVRDDGFDAMKFFPASAAGGPPMLSALAGPFTEIVFCPTGGVSANNAKDYLALPNVLCVGGSWVAPAELIAQKDWNAIRSLASDCQHLKI